MTLRSERRFMFFGDVVAALNAAPESEMVTIESLSEGMQTNGDVSDMMGRTFESLLDAKDVIIDEKAWKECMKGLLGRAVKAIPLPKRWLW